MRFRTAWRAASSAPRHTIVAQCSWCAARANNCDRGCDADTTKHMRNAAGATRTKPRRGSDDASVVGRLVCNSFIWTGPTHRSSTTRRLGSHFRCLSLKPPRCQDRPTPRRLPTVGRRHQPPPATNEHLSRMRHTTRAANGPLIEFIDQPALLDRLPAPPINAKQLFRLSVPEGPRAIATHRSTDSVRGSQRNYSTTLRQFAPVRPRTKQAAQRIQSVQVGARWPSSYQAILRRRRRWIPLNDCGVLPRLRPMLGACRFALRTRSTVRKFSEPYSISVASYIC